MDRQRSYRGHCDSTGGQAERVSIYPQIRLLAIPRASLYHWIRQGLVQARQLDEPLHRWVVWADETEQERLRQFHQRSLGDDLRQRWTDVPLAEQS